jgi:hypothetical protein
MSSERMISADHVREGHGVEIRIVGRGSLLVVVAEDSLCEAR